MHINEYVSFFKQKMFNLNITLKNLYDNYFNILFLLSHKEFEIYKFRDLLNIIIISCLSNSN